jgi:hypothetical protein
MAKNTPKLLHGPYDPPPFRKGQKAWCLYRDREVKVVGWSDAPTSWPLCTGVDPPSGPGLLVEETLSRAVRRESALAVGYWFGVGRMTVSNWRRALGVTRTNNEGSQILIHAATALALEEARRAGLSDEERARRSRLIREVQPWRNSPGVTYGVAWLPEHIALLGTIPDREVAERTGHTLNAVRIRRRKEEHPRP